MTESTIQTLPMVAKVPIPIKSRPIKTDKPRPFLCSICTRGFVRHEHLKRHKISHTDEKPFLCIFCGRCFARKDLVLRHQYKLHPTLISKKDSNENNPSNNYVGNENIVKIKGNKQTILPTPLNPLGMTIAQLKKQESTDILTKSRKPLTQKVQKVEKPTEQHLTVPTIHKRKRHASFSASNAYTYRPDNMEGLLTSTVAEELPKDTPHQVGFSTPQLSANRLFEKVFDPASAEYNDLVQFSLDETFSMNGNHSNTHMANGLNNDPKFHSNINSQLNTTNIFSNNQPVPSTSFLSLANLLTIGNVGEGGYSNNDIILNNISKNNNSSSMSNLIDYFNHTETNPLNNQNNIANTSNNNMNGMDAVYDENWLSDFLAINSQFQNLDPESFKISSKHFNDIGFVDQGSNHSPTYGSSTVSSAVSPNILDPHAISSSTSIEQTVSPNTNINNSGFISKVDFINSDTDKKVDTFDSLFTKNSLNVSPQQKVFKSNNKRRGSLVTNLFTSRQRDLFDEDSNILVSLLDKNIKISPMDVKNSIRKTAEPKEHFTEILRQYIIKENNLTSDMFPTIIELNSYVNLYILKFHPFFPFIYLNSIETDVNNYAFILSITVIGALFAFHSSHAMLLSRVSWFHIKSNINKMSEKHNYAATPIWIIQSMILLIFINIFNNDLSIAQKKIIHTQMKTLIELVKITKLNLPLEMIETPPIESDHVMQYQDNPEVLTKFIAQYSTSEQIKKNFQYFIKAQTRIRTCHTILVISNMFTSMVGLECSFHSIDVKGGIPCYLSELFECKDEFEWNAMLQQNGIILDSKFSLLELSNGGETYENCLNYLASGNTFLYENEKLSLKTLLSLLIAVHEKIFLEGNKLSVTVKRNTLQGELQWRMNARPTIESALKNWEALYLKNGGILVTDETNISVLTTEFPETIMIIPLHALACIRKCLDLTPIMNTVWLQDWEKMNKIMENKFLYCDVDSLHEAIDHALSVVNFWVDSVSIANNARKTSKRTPIFAIMCIFISIFIISEQIKRIEDWAIATENEALSPESMPPMLRASDRIMWLRCEKILKKVEMHLLPKGYNRQTYAEFLRVQANGALDVEVLDDQLAEIAMRPETPISQTIKVIKKAKLSTRCLYLGVRILGDAPIWPIALLFAHALQSRAIYSFKNQNSAPAKTDVHNQFGTMNMETYYLSTAGAFQDIEDDDNGILRL